MSAAGEHLEADGRYHPRHWCAWCGTLRGRVAMKLVLHHLTGARALKCVDEIGCCRRQVDRRNREAA